MIDIEAAYYVDTDLLEVSAPPTPRRRLLAVLRATHAMKVGVVQQVVLVVHRKQVEMVEQEFQQRLQDQQ